jgi:hypothetical protein
MNIACVQLKQKIGKKICQYQLVLLMCLGIAFPCFSQVKIDSPIIKIDSTFISDSSAKASQKNTNSTADKNIGKLPFKQSQLPQLGLCILLLGTIASLRYFFPRYLPELSAQTFSLTADARVLKNDRIGEAMPGVFYNILYAVCCAVFTLFSLAFFYKKTNTQVFTFSAVFFAIGLFTAIMVAKYYCGKMLAWMFNQQIHYNIYHCYQIMLRHICTLVMVAAICIILLIKGVVLAKTFLNIALVLMAILYLFHFVKMFLLTRKTTQITFLNILVYFCSVEAIPNAVAVLFLFRILAKASH